MSDFGHAYDPDAEPSSGYTLLPPGDYTMEIVETDYGPNNAGTGTILKCKAQVVGGEYDGKPYYINFNLEHEKPVTQEIGQRDFAALRRATGVLRPQNTADLHFKAFDVTVGITKRKDNGEDQNAIKRYHFDKADNDNTRPPPAARPTPAPAAAQKPSPWRK